MKSSGIVLVLALVWTGAAAGQEPPVDTARVVFGAAKSWGSGDPSPLAVRVEFFRSSSDSPLDSVAVLEAAQSAVMAAGLPPDVAVQAAPVSFPGAHLRIEVNAYRAGEVRFETVFVEAGGQRGRACGREAQWTIGDPLASALHLSHRIRSTVECVKRSYSIDW